MAKFTNQMKSPHNTDSQLMFRNPDVIITADRPSVIHVVVGKSRQVNSLIEPGRQDLKSVNMLHLPTPTRGGIKIGLEQMKVNHVGEIQSFKKIPDSLS